MKQNLPKAREAPPVKLAPITKRVSKAKKGFAVYECDICDPPKSFTRAEHLRRHQLSHKSPDTQCPALGCFKVFYRDDLLQRHIQQHQREEQSAQRSLDHPLDRLSQQPDLSFPGDQNSHHSKNENGKRPDSKTYVSPRGTIMQSTAPDPLFSSQPTISSGNLRNTGPEVSYQRISVLTKRGASVYRDSAFTDSGYTSLGRGLSIELKEGLDRYNSLTMGLTSGDNDNISIAGHSEALSLRSTRLNTVVFEVAQEISSLLPQSITHDQHAMLKSNLTDVLEYFATRISTEEPKDLCRRLMYLVYKYKDQIANSIIDQFEYEEEKEENKPLFSDTSMPLDDKLQLWASKADVPTSSWPEQDDWDKDQEASTEDNDLLDLQEYSNLLLHSPAYKWLQASLDSLLRRMLPGTINAHKNIRNLLVTYFPRASHPSLQNGPALKRVTFTSPWILGFLESQDYHRPLHEALPRNLVLVGSTTSAWATTCEQYIKTVWPGLGLEILEVYTRLLRSPYAPQETYLQSDHIQITFDVSPDCQTLTAQISGMTHSLIEAIEILTWFDSLRHLQAGVSTVIAGCIVNKGKDQDILITPNSEAQHELPKRDSAKDDGQCWLSLFDTPTMLGGIPIPFREGESSGIETSLELLLILVGSRKISKFGGKILIKGFAAALVPTKKAGNFVLWHVVANPAGGHLSYSDAQIRSCLGSYPEDLVISDLQSARHIIGWSNKVQSNTGSSFANYDIEWSGLNRPKAGFAFEKVSIVGGMFVTGGISCVLGKKDKAVHIRARDDYTMRLKWISKKFVVLYDVADKRAWLVDGASALLHLVRASLKRDSSDLFSPQFLYKESSLVEAPPEFSGKQASVFVLTHQSNMSLPLYAKPAATRHETNVGHSGAHGSVTTHTKTEYCLKDRIESIYEVLEQIIAHQADVASEDGVGFRVKTTIRQQLEGFDFMDIATDEDPLWPRTASLQPQGRGWVDFIRAIHAITLFGTGFGELIQPTPASGDTSCRRCNQNVSVPKMADFLTVCISDIREILQKQGTHATNPWRLVDDIYWHMPEPPFDPCRCSSTSKLSELSSRRVQVLLPSTLPRFWRGDLSSPSDLSLACSGAVLFGYSSRFPLRWGDLGVPVVGPLINGIDNLDASLADNMLGTSMGSSSTPGEHSTSTSLSIGAEATEVSSVSDDSNGEPARKRSRTLQGWLGRYRKIS